MCGEDVFGLVESVVNLLVVCRLLECLREGGARERGERGVCGMSL